MRTDKKKQQRFMRRAKLITGIFFLLFIFFIVFNLYRIACFFVVCFLLGVLLIVHAKRSIKNHTPFMASYGSLPMKEIAEAIGCANEDAQSDFVAWLDRDSLQELESFISNYHGNQKFPESRLRVFHRIIGDFLK